MLVNNHPEAQWFKSAGFGMFIHWGIASVAGVDLSWGILKNKPWFKGFEEKFVEFDRYCKLAEEFSPCRYNPDKWIAAARQAGMEYAVFTTRHHDGYAMWPSEFGEFGVKQYLNGRDLVGEFVQACRRQGLKVGLYYSLSDWYHAKMFNIVDYSDFSSFMEKPLTDVEDLMKFERFYPYIKGQIRELITRYGKIDVLWFDGQIWNDSIDNRMNEIYSMVRAEQPNILINDRGGDLGNFKTPECQLSGAPIPGLWESCYIWQFGGWGYETEENYRDMDWTLKLLSKIRSGGGNLLLNVGPRPDGELPDVVYERLKAFNQWMQHSSPSIKNVNGGVWPPKCSMPVTTSNGIWYVHVHRDHQGTVVLKDVPVPESVALLRNHQRLEYTHNDGSLTFTVPEEECVSSNEVVAITWKLNGTGYKNDYFQLVEE